ncbi:hypothetical protein ABH903_003364 [Brevibacterium epidermidis]|jgi:hypothetical protein|uniref:Uncharacterized protein n=1 Tax=Brevibacterium epidermidis TaxID=1698 RepID=A0ABV4EPY2_BREEP
MSMAEIATLGASGGTLVLAGVALWQSFQTKAQIKLGKDQLQAAEQAAHNATEVHREAIRGRVDQFAPRVSVHYGAVEGPHFSSASLSREQRTEALVSDGQRSAEGMQFVLPKDGDGYIWFSGRALVVNEGNAVARVRLPSEARFIEGHSSIAGRHVELPLFLNEDILHEATLPPGEHALFEWSAGKTVSNWASAAEAPGRRRPGGSIWLWCVVFDLRADGTIDTLMAHFEPELLSAVQGSTGVWQVKEPDRLTVNALPTQRGYRSEGAFTEDVSPMHEYHGVERSPRSANPTN